MVTAYRYMSKRGTIVEQESRLSNKVLVILIGTEVSRGYSDSPLGKIFVRPSRQCGPRFFEIYLRLGRFHQAMQAASHGTDW